MKQQPLRRFLLSCLNPFFKNLLPKNVPRGLFEHSVSRYFFSLLLFLFFWRASFLLVVSVDKCYLLTPSFLMGQFGFVAEVGAEKVSLVSIK